MVLRRYFLKLMPGMFILVRCTKLVFWMIIVSFQAVRVAFFAEGADADEARAAGADIVGGLELIEEIAGNEPIFQMLYGYQFLLL